MRNAVGLCAALLALSSVVCGQEIGKVTIRPDSSTGKLYADIPVRPDGERVDIVRGNKVVASGTIQPSERMGVSLIALEPASARQVQQGDAIVVASAPAVSAAAQPSETLLARPAAPAAPAPVQMAQAPAPSNGNRMPPLSEVTQPSLIQRQDERQGQMPAAPRPISFDEPAPEYAAPATSARVYPRLTPRNAEVPLLPAPAVQAPAAGGILGPYGPGLAAAAPVGTPYLRSPAFAGPPIIYMPQTVTRVLVPGIDPYPSQVMNPAQNYAYASAPFQRTDIYVNLPYGTFYWPQGYAGTTPVEPQVPAYVIAPSQAILTAEAAYSTQRYDPEIGSPEATGGVASVTSPAPAYEPPVAPSVPDSAISAPAVPALPPLPPLPSTTAPEPVQTSAPAVPIFDPSAAMPPSPAPALPMLDGPPATTPFDPSAAITLPPAPAPAAPSPGADKPGIVVDDQTPGGLVFEPASGWNPSFNVADSYEQRSLIGSVDGTLKTATYFATIPEAGRYEVYLWWVASSPDFRSASVPVTVYAADGEKQATVDQTSGSRQFNLVGTYEFLAGENQRVLRITTDGVTPGPTVNISVDALKLVKAE